MSRNDKFLIAVVVILIVSLSCYIGILLDSDSKPVLVVDLPQGERLESIGDYPGSNLYYTTTDDPSTPPKEHKVKVLYTNSGDSDTMIVFKEH
jgi:hypothetical protein